MKKKYRQIKNGGIRMFKKILCALLAATMLAAAMPTGVFATNESAKGEITVKGLQVEYLTNPIGIDVETPRLSWYIESSERGTLQKSYRIAMATSLENLSNGKYNIWDSDTVTSDATTGIVYSGDPLPKKTRIYWQVTVTDQKGNTATSEPAYFETGLMDGDWGDAQWITNTQDSGGAKNKSFTLTVDFKILTTSAGIFFGAEDSNNRYMWQFREYNGSLILRTHKWTNGTCTYPNGWAGVKAGEMSAVTDSFATLKIVVTEGNIVTYLNGTKLAELNVDPFEMGYVGFRQSGSEKAEFDNFKVTDENGNVLVECDFSDSDNNPFVSGTLTEEGTLISTGDAFNYAEVEETEKENADDRPLNTYTNMVNDPAPMFRKEFSTTGAVSSARLYITSAGTYDAYINGKPVTDSLLNPGRTDYNNDLKYQVFDVTDLIADGDNAIGAFVGHGWYSTKWNNFGTKFALLALLEIKYENGEVQTVVTDDTWTSYNDGPLQYEDLMNGLTFDATKAQEGWAEGGFDDSDWSTVTLTDSAALKVSTPCWTRVPLITVGDVFTPVQVTHPQDNMVVYDFGVNFAGIPYVKIKGEAGQKIMFRYGELLNSEELATADGEPGSVYRGNLTDAQATDYYILSGDPDGEIFYPKMTNHGFRYMEVSGVNFTVTEANMLEVEGHALYSDLERTGYFETSDEMVNQLYENSYRSNVSNFLGIPSDCPQRGERTGWTADAQVYSRTASFNLNTFAFLEEYSFNLTKGISDIGTYPEVTPAPTWKTSAVENGWGDAGVIIPWTMYLTYGDTKILSDNYEGMKGLIDAFIAASNSDYERNDVAKYGDWFAVESTPATVTNNAYSAYVTQIVAKIAAVLGYTDEAEEYEEIAEKFRQAFVRVCTDGNGRTLCNTQTSYVLGLAFDLFDEEDRAAAEENLASLIRKNDFKLTTGFLGINFLNPVLSDIGESELAYKLLMQKEYPSWLYPVTLGATSIFERWDGLKETTDGGLTTRGSLNHYAYGSVAEWMYRYVLGIDLDEENPGYKHIILHPVTDSSLTYAKGSYLSQHGQIVSEWKFEDGDTVYNFTVPANTTATLTLADSAYYEITESGVEASRAEGVTRLSNNGNDAVFELASGSYTFTVKGSAPGGDVCGNVISADGYSIRLTDKNATSKGPALRAEFTLSQSALDTATEKGYTLVDYGVVVFSANTVDSVYGGDETAVIADFMSGEYDTVRIKSVSALKGPYVKVHENGDKTFAAAVTGIPSDNFTSAVYTYAYTEWTSDGGETVLYRYTTYTSESTGKTAHSLYDLTVFAFRNGIANSQNTDEDKLWPVLEKGAYSVKDGEQKTFYEGMEPSVKYEFDANGEFTYFNLPLRAWVYYDAWDGGGHHVEDTPTTNVLWSLLKDGDELIVAYRRDPNAAEDATAALPKITDRSTYSAFAPFSSDYFSPGNVVSWASYKGIVESELVQGDMTTNGLYKYANLYSPILTDENAAKITALVVDYGINAFNTSSLENTTVPNLKTIVYPEGVSASSGILNYNSVVEEVIYCSDRKTSLSSKTEGIGKIADLSGLESMSLGSAFAGAKMLENIILPTTVTRDDSSLQYLFYNSNSLRRVWTLGAAVPARGTIDLTGTGLKRVCKEAFNGLPKASVILMPASFEGVGSYTYKFTEAGACSQALGADADYTFVLSDAKALSGEGLSSGSYSLIAFYENMLAANGDLDSNGTIGNKVDLKDANNTVYIVYELTDANADNLDHLLFTCTVEEGTLTKTIAEWDAYFDEKAA